MRTYMTFVCFFINLLRCSPACRFLRISGALVIRANTQTLSCVANRKTSTCQTTVFVFYSVIFNTTRFH